MRRLIVLALLTLPRNTWERITRRVRRVGVGAPTRRLVYSLLTREGQGAGDVSGLTRKGAARGFGWIGF